MNYDEESVIGFDPLYESMFRTKKGVDWKDSVASYYHRGVERTDALSKGLHDGTYHAAPTKYFTITSPKPRVIGSVAYRDRIYQRSLNDNVVYPVMTNSFIHDNYACQKGKGTDAARDCLKRFLRRYYRKYGTVGYVAQFDIHGYYPNMRHDVAEALFKEKLPGWAYDRVETILHGQYPGDVGYNPGSQLIQIAGISILDKLDHFIKERLHVKLYERYMDDFLLIHHDMHFLEHCKEETERELAKNGFELNPKKTRIYPLSEGIKFLGFTFYLSNTGKVYMIADSKKVKSGREKYKRLVAKAKRGEVSRDSVDSSFATWINHLSKGNSQKLVSRLTKYYNDLWRNCDYGNHHS